MVSDLEVASRNQDYLSQQNEEPPLEVEEENEEEVLEQENEPNESHGSKKKKGKKLKNKQSITLSEFFARKEDEEHYEIENVHYSKWRYTRYPF